MDWNADRIIFKIDGIEHYRYNPSAKNASNWPYDSEFFFLLNIAIEPSIQSSFTESAMEIDYVRVYKSGNLVWSDEFNAESSDEQMSWDLDENGEVDALTDGLLFLRSTFELTGDALLEGVTSSASVLSNEQITQNISDLYQIADIDGNGEVDALTDALTLLRYLFELRNDALIEGVIDEGATRTSASEIEAYIESHMP
jgi:hypothetical protein